MSLETVDFDNAKHSLSIAVRSCVDNKLIVELGQDRPAWGWRGDFKDQVVEEVVTDILKRCLSSDIYRAYVIVESVPAPNSRLVVSQVYAPHVGKPDRIEKFEAAVSQGEPFTRFDLGPAIRN